MKKNAQKIKTFYLYFLIILLIFVEAVGVVPVNAKENKTAFEKQIINTNIQKMPDEDISNSVNQAEGDMQTNSALLSKSIIPHSDKTTQDSTTNTYTVKAVSAQTWNSTHEITYFQGNKPGAVSISFDDGLPYQEQDTNGVSQLNARGLKGTFFVVTDWISTDWRDSWATWQSVAAQGHEVASHTVTHPRLTTLSDNEVRWELSKSQSDINQNIPGNNAISLSYPNTAENGTIDAIAGEYYVASRVAWAKEGAYLNYYQPFSDEFGSYKTVNFNTVAAMEMDGVSVNNSDFNSRLDRAILNHAWFNLYFHTISDATAFGNVLDYVQAKQSFWIDTFGNVSRYMKERLNSTIQVITDTPSEIRLQLVMGGSLPTAIYNVPLTVRSTVPVSWSQVVVQQGSAIQTITPVMEGSETAIYYNALPNGGDIVLIPLNPVLGLESLNPASVFVGGSSFTLTIIGANFVNGSIVRWNNSDRATTYVSATQLTVSIPASDITSIGTAEVRVFNPSLGEVTSNQLYFAVTPKPVTVTINPGQAKTYGSVDPIFTYASSDPSVTFTGALSRASGESVGAFAINQGTLAVVDSNYSITSFVPANFTITPKPITITVIPGQSKVYGDTDKIFSYTSSSPSATLTGTLNRASGESVGTYVINQGTLAVVGNNYAIASFVPTNFTITSSTTNSNLSNLVFSTGALSPAFTFASGTTTYTQSVANAVASLTVTPTVADATATVKVNGTTVASGSASGSIALAVGSNTITTIVTAQDGTTTKTYTVTVTRASPSTNANLSGLAFSTGTLIPAFTLGTTTYAQSVAYAVTSLTVTPTVADATATIKVNGTAVASSSASGSIALAVGETVINTVVTAQDGTTTKIYTITVTRASPSINANLSELVFSTGALTPAFTSGTTIYTQSVANAVTSLTVTPTLADATATVKVNGTTVVSGSASGSISLPVGDTVINTVVTAQDGTTIKTYTVTVTRAPNPAKDITAFSFTSPMGTGVITGTNIAVTVPFGTDITALVATITTTGASVRVGASTQISGATPNNFSSSVTYTVVAADSTTKNYSVSVTVAANPAKAITAFSFASPAATGIINETAHTIAVTVPYGTVITLLIPTIIHSGASVSPSGAQNFTNPVTYTVTAHDATTQAYVVTVTVAANPAKAITGFSFSSPTAAGVINDTAHTIVVTVPYGTDVTALVATFTTTGTTIQIGNTTQVSNTTANNFTSPVTYTVTAADSTTKAYTVTVIITPHIIASTVSTIVRANPSPTVLTSVRFTVTFSAPVTGVDTGDFSLTTIGGVSGASITSVSGSGATYTVTVNTGSGRGMLRLNILDDNSILNAASSPLGGPAVGDGNFGSGEFYMINKPIQDVVTDTWVMKVSPSTNLSQLALQLGAQNLGQIGSLTGYYLFRISGSDTQPKTATDLLAANPQILWFEQQTAHQQSARGNSNQNGNPVEVITATATIEDVQSQDNADNVSATNTPSDTVSTVPTETAITIIESSPELSQLPTFTQTIAPLLQVSPIPTQTPIVQIQPSSTPTRSVQSAKIAVLSNKPLEIPTTMIRSIIPNTGSENNSSNDSTKVPVVIIAFVAVGSILFSMRRKINMAGKSSKSK
jgi:peptidoglycan/xylan/chitin deacetylase (PgdA/CDA1 family)